MKLSSPSQVAERIRSRREELELTQGELANEVARHGGRDVGQSTVCGWEAVDPKKRFTPRQDLWEPIAKALKSDVSELFFDSSPKQRRAAR